MGTKAIRGIREDEWAEIKAMASREGLPIGRYLVKANEEVKKKGNLKAWEKILSFRFSNHGDADKIAEAVREFRKRFKLREFK